MTPIRAIGKYLDQPLLTAKINKVIPAVLLSGAGFVLHENIENTPKSEHKKTAIKSSAVLFTTALSALSAPKIASAMTGRKGAKTLKQIINYNIKTVDDFLKNNHVNSNLEKILQKSKTKILSLKEVNDLFSSKETANIAKKIIPPPDNIKAKDIFREIGWLSVYGAVPVLGGIAGGILGDKFTHENWREGVPDKIKEGTYQYLANIFLCNIGAGAALGALEKLNITSKAARCLGMIGGILLTGVIGGSIIANFIGNKILNPIMKQDKKEIRTPEFLDLTLHTDDIATVSLLSGLKWIEPSLPLLYSISGYRAGIGYRNDDKSNNNKSKSVFLRNKC